MAPVSGQDFLDFFLPIPGKRFLTAAFTFFCSVAVPFWATRAKAFRACALSGIGYLRFPGNANDFLLSFFRSLVLSSFAMRSNFAPSAAHGNWRPSPAPDPPLRGRLSCPRNRSPVNAADRSHSPDDSDDPELSDGAGESADATTTDILAEMAQLVASGQILTAIAATYPLDHLRQAYTELEQRHTRGKIVWSLDRPARLTTDRVPR